MQSRSRAHPCRSVPVQKSPGDEVFAGTINGDGSLTVESTKPVSDTTLARITRMEGSQHGYRRRTGSDIFQLPSHFRVRRCRLRRGRPKCS